MVDFVIHVHRVHLDILEVKTSLGVLNYPTAATMKRYQGQIRHVGRDKRTNISSYNSMNTKQDGGPQRPRTRAQSLYKAYYDSYQKQNEQSKLEGIKNNLPVHVKFT